MTVSSLVRGGGISPQKVHASANYWNEFTGDSTKINKWLSVLYKCPSFELQYAWTVQIENVLSRKAIYGRLTST